MTPATNNLLQEATSTLLFICDIPSPVSFCEEFISDLERPVLTQSTEGMDLASRFVYTIGQLGQPPLPSVETAHETAQKILFRAIKIECTPLVRMILDLGFPASATNSKGKSALHVAASIGNADISRLLLEHGADPTARNSDGMSPALIGISQKLNLRELGLSFSYEDKQFVTNKLMIDLFDIPDDIPINGWTLRQGNYHSFVSPYLIDAIEALQGREGINESDSHLLATIFEAFSEEQAAILTLDEITQKIQSGQLCILKGGWEGHSLVVCFFNGYMALCNRGSKPNNSPSIDVYQLEMYAVTPEVVSLISYPDFAEMDGKHFFYTYLPMLVTPIESESGKDDFCQVLSTDFSPKDQRAPNCILTSSETAILASLLMLKSQCQLDFKALQAADTLWNYFIAFSRVYHYDQYSSLMYEVISKNPKINDVIENKLMKYLTKLKSIQESLARNLTEEEGCFFGQKGLGFEIEQKPAEP